MNLDEVRVKINDINDQMLALFKERMELSKDVAAAKKEMNKAIYDAKRERDILDKVTKDAGPDLDLYARRFFEALFSLSRTYQSEQLFQDNEFTLKMKKAIEQSPTLPPQRGSVACAGVFGSNAQMACDKLLPLSQIHRSLYCNRAICRLYGPSCLHSQCVLREGLLHRKLQGR